MTKQSPMHILLDLAQGRVEDATKRLGELLASEHACERKLEMLTEYRAEYRDRFMQAARDGIGPDAWRNYSAFLGKLDEAIAAQQQLVDQSKRLTMQGQEKWVHERNRMKAFDLLSSRERDKEVKKVAQQEQRQSDEHAAKKYRDADDT